MDPTDRPDSGVHVFASDPSAPVPTPTTASAAERLPTSPTSPSVPAPIAPAPLPQQLLPRPPPHLHHALAQHQLHQQPRPKPRAIQQLPLPDNPPTTAGTRVTMPDPSGSVASGDTPPPSFTVYQTMNLDPSHPNYQSPAAAVLAASAPPALPGSLNPRSCVTCRRRKVRCDKLMPCSNCRRNLVPCVFPAPGRAPRKPKPRDPNAPPPRTSSQREIELRQRLRKLEGIVEELSGQLEIEPGGGGSVGSVGSGSHHRDKLAHANHEHAQGHAHGGGGAEASSPVERLPSQSRSSTMSPRSLDRPPRESRPSVDDGSARPSTGSDDRKQFGRLVMHEKGKTRYVSGGFWTKLNDELEEIRRGAEQLHHSDSDDYEDDDDGVPVSPIPAPGFSDHHAFVLGYSSTDIDLGRLHPLPSLIPYIWETYLENVEVWIKILHVPTMEKVLKDVRKHIGSLDPGHEALLFAIYYAVVTSLEEDEVQCNFGAPKDVLCKQYRFAVEQALAKANFLTSSAFVVLQAFVLFLIIVRRHDDTRFCWSLSCIAIRVAQGMGLHRDGTHFDLSPYEIEMRRRLWWNICILDLRSAEGLGTDLTITEDSFDTQLPSNINDADLSPEMTGMPPPRRGHSDCAAAMTRWTMLRFSRRLQAYAAYAAGTGTGSGPHPAVTFSEEDKTRDLREIAEQVDNDFLTQASPDEHPELWVASIISRIIQCKLTIVIHQSTLASLTPAPPDTRQKMFVAALQIIIYSQVAFTDPRCRHWLWLFLTYTQWHAIAYTLMEASRREWCPILELWWEALYATLRKTQAFHLLEPAVADASSSSIISMPEHSALWLPLQTLFVRARRRRVSELRRLRRNPDAARDLKHHDFEGLGKLFMQVHGVKERAAEAKERWMIFVGLSDGRTGLVPASIKEEYADRNEIREAEMADAPPPEGPVAPPPPPPLQQQQQQPMQPEHCHPGHIQPMAGIITSGPAMPFKSSPLFESSWSAAKPDSVAGFEPQTSAPPAMPSHHHHHHHHHQQQQQQQQHRHQPQAVTPSPLSQPQQLSPGSASVSGSEALGPQARHAMFPHHQPSPPGHVHLSPQQQQCSPPQQQVIQPAVFMPVNAGPEVMSPKDPWLWSHSFGGHDALDEGDINMDLDGFDWFDWNRKMGALQMGGMTSSR